MDRGGHPTVRPTPRSVDSTTTSRIDVLTGSRSARTYRTSVSSRLASFTAQILAVLGARFGHELENPTRLRHEIENPTRNLGSYNHVLLRARRSWACHPTSNVGDPL